MTAPMPNGRRAIAAARPRRRMPRGAAATIAPVAVAALLAIAPSWASPAAGPGATPVAADVAFERANQAFAEGRYADAADAYAAIAEREGVSAALLFNLGNASFRAGRTGEAILAWERARLLAPRASAIAANLRQARRAAALPAGDPDLWQRLVGLLTADGWTWLASACLTIACAAGVAAAALRGRAPARAALARATRIAIACSLALLAVAVAATASALATRERGVVVGRDPALRVAPYPSATTARPVAPGEVVQMERLHAGFALVRTDDGRTGWLPQDAVRRIGDVAAFTGLAAPATRSGAAGPG